MIYQKLREAYGDQWNCIAPPQSEPLIRDSRTELIADPNNLQNTQELITVEATANEVISLQQLTLGMELIDPDTGEVIEAQPGALAGRCALQFIGKGKAQTTFPSRTGYYKADTNGVGPGLDGLTELGEIDLKRCPLVIEPGQSFKIQIRHANLANGAQYPDLSENIQRVIKARLIGYRLNIPA